MQLQRIFIAVALGVFLLPATLKAQQVRIIVSNSGNVQRQELIEVDIKDIRQKLKLGENESFVVKNSKTLQQVDYQITHDGKLLVDAGARPRTQAVFIVEKGEPEKMKHWTYGAQYKIRKDDITWENDRGAYRVYGPALQKTGEKSFGIDIWTKNTPDLVVPNRYRMELEGNIIEDSLRRLGLNDQAKAVDRATSFHLDHGYGMDAYSVGPTLGCGAPALMLGDSLLLPYCYKEYRILDNGPLRFTMQLTFNPIRVGKDKAVVEHRIISLDKGANYNRMTVWYEGLSQPRNLATGVVLHTEDTTGVVLGSDFLLYADPTDDMRDNTSQLYVGVLFPKPINEIKKLMYPKPQGFNAGHLIGIVRGLRNNERYTYYFGSAWSRYDVKSLNEWRVRSEEFLLSLKNPLKVEIK